MLDDDSKVHNNLFKTISEEFSEFYSHKKNDTFFSLIINFQFSFTPHGHWGEEKSYREKYFPLKNEKREDFWVSWIINFPSFVGRKNIDQLCGINCKIFTVFSSFSIREKVDYK